MCLQPLLQVFALVIQKPFFLQEPQEHEPVDDDGRVPALVFAVGRYALDESSKGFALFFKLAVELLGDFVARRSVIQPLGDAQHGEQFLFVQREVQAAELLRQQFGRFALAKEHLAVLGGFASLARHPLPDLEGLGLIGEHDQVFAHVCRDLAFDLLPSSVVGQLALGAGAAVQHLHALFVGNYVQQPGVVAHEHAVGLLLGRGVPAEFVEELFEAVMLDVFLVENRHVYSSLINPMEHTTRGSLNAASSSA